MKHAVISGGATSIGFETARQLTAQGVGVSLIDIDAVALEKAVASLDELAEPYVANVTNAEDVERVAREIIAKHPSIAYLVNTPSANPKVPFREYSMSAIRETVDLTLTAYAYTIRALWDVLERAGSIVNISSVHGFTTYPGNSMYAASKAGVESLTRALAAELREKQVRINAVAPGGFTSELYQAEIPDWQERLAKEQIFTTEAMADIVLFLLNDKSKAINGETIIADGGVFTVRGRSSDW